MYRLQVAHSRGMQETLLMDTDGMLHFVVKHSWVWPAFFVGGGGGRPGWKSLFCSPKRCMIPPLEADLTKKRLMRVMLGHGSTEIHVGLLRYFI